MAVLFLCFVRTNRFPKICWVLVLDRMLCAMLVDRLALILCFHQNLQSLPIYFVTWSGGGVYLPILNYSWHCSDELSLSYQSITKFYDYCHAKFKRVFEIFPFLEKLPIHTIDSKNLFWWMPAYKLLPQIFHKVYNTKLTSNVKGK